MRILELGKGGPEEAELLDAAARTHGAWVHAASRQTARIFLMRSAWAPGLRAVGALVAPDGRSVMPPLSASGAGLKLEDGLAACLGEAVERAAQIERPGDVVLTAPPASVDLADQVMELIERLAGFYPGILETPIDWVRARSCNTGAEALVPADWCLRRPGLSAAAVPGNAVSTGCGAGAIIDDAVSAGLLELIERDAASLWWLGGHRGRRLTDGSLEATALGRLSGELRAGFPDRPIRVIDITGDMGVPVVAAISHGNDGAGPTVGLAASLTLVEATRRAVLELCQMELGMQLALAKHRQLGVAALTAEDRRHIRRAGAQIDGCAPIRELSEPAASGMAGASRPAEPLAALLSRQGIDAWTVDLTRAGSGLAVAKVIAPRLQLMPCAVETARLHAARQPTEPPQWEIF